MPKVTVIVPIYKTERYVEKCLRSVQEQTLADIEIIAVDDQSPDASGEIVATLAKSDPRIRLVRHEKNLGLGGARNTGLRMASAPYVASVDSDDYLVPEMLERLLEGTEGGKVDVVVCGFDRINEEGERLSTWKPKDQLITNSNNSINIFKLSNPAFWNKLWRTDLYTKNEIWFPNHVFYQDLATTPRIYALSHRIRLLDESLYRYLIRSDSATYTASPKHLLDFLTVFETLDQFLHDRDLVDRYGDDFRLAINQSLKHHSANILASAASDDEKARYLRQLLQLRLGFLEYYPHTKAMDVRLLAKHVASARVRSDIVAAPKTELPISVVVKTFLRPAMLARFLGSVGSYQDRRSVKFSEVLVGDDSPASSKTENKLAINRIREKYPHLNIRLIELDLNIGTSAGRNRLADAATQPYVLMCDDDFLLDDDCDYAGQIAHIETGGFDMVGGWLKNKYELDTGAWEYWGTSGSFSEGRDEWILELNETSQDAPDLVETDYLLNFFICKTQLLRNVQYDESLKTEEHPDFFYRLFHSPFRAAFSKGMFVKHSHERNNNPPEYNEHRYGKQAWENFLFKSLQNIGKSHRTMHRWRDTQYVRWEVDAIARTSRQVTLPLREPTLSLNAPCERITPKYRNFFFGYYDVRAESADGRIVLCQTAPVINRLPTAEHVAEVGYVAVDKPGAFVPLGATSAWCHQQGAHLQFLGNGSDVVYNTFNEETRQFNARIVNVATGDDRVLPRAISAVTQDGSLAASLNFSRVYDYRPGYGYPHVPDPWHDENAPSEDGLFVMEVATGKSRLVLSYRNIEDCLATGPYASPRGAKWIINHTQFSPSGKQLLLLVRTFSGDPPFPTFTLVCNADGTNLRRVFGFSSHYHWKDEVTIVVSGAPGFTRAECREIGVYEVNTRTLEFAQILPGILRNDGHCSYSPDRTLLLYDSYSNTAFPYRKIQVADLLRGQAIDVGYYHSEPRLSASNTDLRCDLHPRWSPDGQSITFDSVHEGFRAVYRMHVSDIRRSLAAGNVQLLGPELRRWYSAKYGEAGETKAPIKKASPTKAPIKRSGKTKGPIKKASQTTARQHKAAFRSPSRKIWVIGAAKRATPKWIKQAIKRALGRL